MRGKGEGGNWKLIGRKGESSRESEGPKETTEICLQSPYMYGKGPLFHLCMRLTHKVSSLPNVLVSVFMSHSHSHCYVT